MKLEKVEVELKTWGENKGKYIAHVRLASGRDSISLEISPRISTIILHACVDEMESATRKAANDFADKLRAAVAGVPRLAAPVE